MRRRFPYVKEFSEMRRKVIKSRVRLFCILTIIIYIATAALSVLFNPAEFRTTELLTWAFLITASLITLFVNHRTVTLAGTKLNAIFFSISLITALSALFFIYPEYVSQSYGILALSLFFISFVIPWKLLDLILIGGLHLAGFAAICFRVWPAAAQEPGAQGPMQGFIDGAIFLTIALILAVVIRGRDDDREMENFALLKELEAKNAQTEKELALARDIHKTLIPKSTSTDNATIAVNYIPLSSVGGDYAKFHVTKDGSLFFLIGDITGHGIPAALLVNRIYGEVETLIAKDPTPGLLLRELDKFVHVHFQQTEMYLSVCCGLIDFNKKTLLYSNYGHPPQILHQRKNNTIRLLESQTYLLGIDSGEEHVKIYEGSMMFEPKDRMVLFTDGLIETRGAADEEYGMERLEAFIKSAARGHPSIFNGNLLKEIEDFRTGPVTDDIFLVTIDIV